MRLPSAGQRVTLESAGDILLRPDFRPRMTTSDRVVYECLGAERVIGVAMRIDDERERVLAELANRAHRLRAHLPRAGIDDDHLAAAVRERDVGEAVEHRDSRLDHF